MVWRVVWCHQLPVPYLLDVCVQLASGVHQLHEGGIIHRDLKADNALVQGRRVKWADFGCSVKGAVINKYGEKGTRQQDDMHK